MRYGFVLDQGSCIGCHACTVACKAENDVVLGSFRTWVKWIEHGEFPNVDRSAAVLRCNHCTDAPCIEICPTVALFKREDGIVDLDRDRCIGCASCLQACPYDALHIDDRSGTAAKCHFCAHRLEVDLAPACVSVCPEQAIKVVDLDDRETRSALGSAGATVRKPERRTAPQTFYVDADPVALQPLQVDGSRTLSHAEVPDPMPAVGTAEAKSVYDIPKARPWGPRIAAYLVTKAIASGALLAASCAFLIDGLDQFTLSALAVISLVFLTATCGLLISDLHQPRRFYFLLTKANPGSWLVRGGWILAAHGVLSLAWLVVPAAGSWSLAISLLGIPVALATSVYTAFLFWQARGRELWSEDRMLALVLATQSFAAAAALCWIFGFSNTFSYLGLVAYAAMTIASASVRPPTEHSRAAHQLMLRHWSMSAGVAAALAALVFPPLVIVAFALLDWIYVKAGQEIPLS